MYSVREGILRNREEGGGRQVICLKFLVHSLHPANFPVILLKTDYDQGNGQRILLRVQRQKCRLMARL